MTDDLAGENNSPLLQPVLGAAAWTAAQPTPNHANGKGIGAQDAAATDSEPGGAPMSVPTELMQLRVRIIALENVLIAVLAHSSEAQLQMAWEMASFISPRLGHLPHPLTLRAAAEMRSLVDRAAQFRASPGA